MPMVYNARTGKFKPLSVSRSRVAKKAALKRKNKPLKAATRMKISKTMLKNRTDKRNRFGVKIRRRR